MLRKALLVGINTYPTSPLRGCLNDVALMEQLLTDTFGFDPANIRILRDAEGTKANILAGLRWLASEGSGDGADEVRVFHFAGHGTFQADHNGDEPDGTDECLVPHDHATAGYLIDDDLATLYATFPSAGNLTLVMDCCHSGTIQKDPVSDVVYRFLPVPPEAWQAIDAARDKFLSDHERYYQEQLAERGGSGLSAEAQDQLFQTTMRSFVRRRGRFGDVSNRERNILLAAARDVQTAADARINGNYNGAFTYHLVDAVRRLGPQTSAAELMAELSEAMTGKYSQVPQLEARPAHKQLPLFAPLPRGSTL